MPFGRSLALDYLWAEIEHSADHPAGDRKLGKHFFTGPLASPGPPAGIPARVRGQRYRTNGSGGAPAATASENLLLSGQAARRLSSFPSRPALCRLLPASSDGESEGLVLQTYPA